MTEEPWYASSFSDAVLATTSDLTLIVTGPDDEGRLSLDVKAAGGELRVEVTSVGPEGEATETITAMREQVLGLWKAVRESGFVERAMEGRALPPGTDVYLSGHAGEAGLGWTLSTSAAGLRSESDAAAVAQALDAFGKEHSELYRKESGRLPLPL
jgi:hypothetical protein